MVNPARSYLSNVETPLTLGLGEAPRLDELTIDWPGGAQETWVDLQSRRTYVIREGYAPSFTDQ